MGETLLDMLSAVVEFWCQQHLKLNQSLVEKGLEDLAEHVAVSASSQGTLTGTPSRSKTVVLNLGVCVSLEARLSRSRSIGKRLFPGWWTLV